MHPVAVVRAAAKRIPAIVFDANRDLIDLEDFLGEQFELVGESELRAAELAEVWLDRMREEVESVLEGWNAIGVPPPAVLLGASGCTTLRHRLYSGRAPRGGLQLDYPSWLALVEGADSKRFTLVVCAWLAAAGCSDIYVVDGANDFGVDCFGVIPDGPLRSVCILGQAKTASGAISVETIRGDYQKYSEGFWGSALANKCIQSTVIDGSSEGFSAPYIFFTNNEYSPRCGEYAMRHRILLRSRRQLAYSLASAFSLVTLGELLSEQASQVRRSPDFNWAPLMNAARI
jgi:hypothetical protein